MSEQTKIEWTDATWNPITGCTLVDQGCKNCYAARLAATRLKHHPSRRGLARLNASGTASFTGEVRLNEDWLDQPLRWRKPRRIFVCAHGDLFHESVPDEWIDRVFRVMHQSDEHIFQVLTKRPERMSRYLNRFKPVIDIGARVLVGPNRWDRKEAAGPPKPDFITRDGKQLNGREGPLFRPSQWPLPNVWLGTSVSDQASAEARIPHLLRTPAAVRFVSAEPLLGLVDLTDLGGWSALDDGADDGVAAEPTLDWVIVGGESGRNARPMHPDWARSLRDQCQAAGVAFFFKQWGLFADHTETHAASKSCTATHDLVITPEGHTIGAGAKGYGGMVDEDWLARGAAWMCATGKHTAGRLLDGREWNQSPQFEAEPPAQGGEADE